MKTEEQFKLIYESYAAKVYNFAKSIVSDTDTAQDIVSEVFLRLWQHKAGLALVSDMSSYLFRITRNVIFDMMRSKTVERKFVEDAKKRQEVLDDSVSDAVDMEELNEVILNVVRQMPAQRRRVFLLSRLYGISNRNIAESLGLNIRTVENHISCVLSALRTELSKQNTNQGTFS